ncbi:putative phage protein (TIGR02218 family) [Xanthomonas translucens]
MAKQIPVALLTHYQQDATTICLLVKVRCTGAFAGVTLGFTSLDAPITYDDGTGALTYSPDYGFTPSAFETSNVTDVDNAEVVGFILDSAITYEMVRSGLFNYAEVTAYEVDYLDLSKGHEVAFIGTCGETTFTDTSWKTEFRSIKQQLTQTISQPYSKDTCRAQFGDARCKMPFTWVAGTVDSPWDGDATRGFTCVALTQASGYFVPGVVEWLSGRNAGTEMDVVASDSGFVRLLLSMPFPIEAGDTFRIRRDCDKSTSMCKAYGNEPNYRMEPLINLTGEGLYSYTAAKMDSNYGSLIGAIIGAIIGYFVGSPNGGAQIGGLIGGLVLPDTAIGPRLSQASTQTNAVTTQIPFGYGRVTMSGNIIEAGDSREKVKKKKNWLGVTTSKTFHYFRSFKVGVMQGQIGGFVEIRRDGKIIYYGGTRAEILFKTLVSNKKVDSTSEVEDLIAGWTGLDALFANPSLVNASPLWSLIYNNATNHGGIPAGQNITVGAMGFLASVKAAAGFDEMKSSAGMKLFDGSEDQVFYPCANLSTNGLSPAYRGLAFAAFNDYEVTDTGGALPTLEFVVDATIPDIYLTSRPYRLESDEDFVTYQPVRISAGRLWVEPWAYGDESLTYQPATISFGEMYDTVRRYTATPEDFVAYQPVVIAGGEQKTIVITYDESAHAEDFVTYQPVAISGIDMKTIVITYDESAHAEDFVTYQPVAISGGSLA